MRNSKLLKAYLLLVVGLTSCKGVLRVESKIYPNIELKSDFRYRHTPDKITIERLLAEVWTSEFLRKNELIEEEILNNNYGVFGGGSESSSLKERRACYIKERGQKDKVMLNTGLFSHFVFNSNGVILHKTLDKRIKATLIHELFHDFWHNILDERERILFSIEAEIFFLEAMMAEKKQDKVIFLRNAGLDEPSERDFKPYAELQDLEENYAGQKFFGAELYSVIADRTFSRKMIIPKQLRKFYYGIISESALNKNRI
ncbi:MAG: hypothetical protein GTN73_05580 [Candidatus Aminicenantes bacterium]|nr:hypothetical protein [Candidatus Aminicenantes bacterium]